MAEELGAQPRLPWVSLPSPHFMHSSKHTLTPPWPRRLGVRPWGGGGDGTLREGPAPGPGGRRLRPGWASERGRVEPAVLGVGAAHQLWKQARPAPCWRRPMTAPWTGVLPGGEEPLGPLRFRAEAGVGSRALPATAHLPRPTATPALCSPPAWVPAWRSPTTPPSFSPSVRSLNPGLVPTGPAPQPSCRRWSLSALSLSTQKEARPSGVHRL